MTDRSKEFERQRSEAKSLLVRNRREKFEKKAKHARKLTDDQITVVSIDVDVPGQGRMSLRPVGGGGHRNSWDADLTDAKIDSDPTDQWFDMDGTDGISDMDPCDSVHRGRGGPIIVAW